MPAAAEPSTDGSRFVVSNWAGREPLRPACVTRRYVILEAPNPLREDKGFDDLKHAYYSTRHNPSVEKKRRLVFCTYLYVPRRGMHDWYAPTPHGQMYLPPSGALKQPTDSGNSVFGSHSTTSGKKIAKAIVAKKIT